MDWYKHEIAKWMDGTEPLTDGEYRAYHVVCQLIYLHNGPITLNEPGIAARCNQHRLAFRNHLKGLLDKGKLEMIGNKISNKKAVREIEKRGAKPVAEKPQPPANPPLVGRGSAGGQQNNLLELLDPPPQIERESKSTKEPNGSLGASATPPPSNDPRDRLFREGLPVLMRMTGKPRQPSAAIIGKWLRETLDDPVAVLRAIEDAAANRVADPVSWIEAALRHRDGQPTRGQRARNGWAAMVYENETRRGYQEEIR